MSVVNPIVSKKIKTFSFGASNGEMDSFEIQTASYMIGRNETLSMNNKNPKHGGRFETDEFKKAKFPFEHKSTDGNIAVGSMSEYGKSALASKTDKKEIYISEDLMVEMHGNVPIWIPVRSNGDPTGLYITSLEGVFLWENIFYGASPNCIDKANMLFEQLFEAETSYVAKKQKLDDSA